MNIHTVQISLDLPDEISPSVHTGCSRDPDEADSSIRTDNLQGEVDPECSNLQHEVDPSLRPESSSLQREIDPSLRTESSIILQDEVDQTSPFEQYTLQDLSTNELSEDTRTSEGHDVTSDGEGDVEIESMCEDGSELDPIQPIQQSSQDSPQTVTFDVRRRTLINVWQRATLEEYYRGGMWSAALQLHHMHVAAAEKTGLDLTVVKNWIRNRRRPTAARSAEKLADYMSQVGSSVPSLSVPTVNPLLTIPSTMVPVSAITGHQFNAIGRQIPSNIGQPAMAVVTGTPTVSVGLTLPNTGSVTFGPPDSKKPRIEPSSILHHRTTSTPSSLHHLSTPTLAPISSQQLTLVSQPTTQASPALPVPMLVRVRISDSGDEDFVEVEVPSLTYQSLLKAICDELEIAYFDVAKIRKLPNILVRKDRDVGRLNEGQELEVILVRTTQGMNHHPPHNTKSLVNPDSDRSILATLSGDSITSTLSELTGGHAGTHQLNGLHH